MALKPSFRTDLLDFAIVVVRTAIYPVAGHQAIPVFELIFCEFNVGLPTSLHNLYQLVTIFIDKSVCIISIVDLVEISIEIENIHPIVLRILKYMVGTPVQTEFFPIVGIIDEIRIFRQTILNQIIIQRIEI